MLLKFTQNNLILVSCAGFYRGGENGQQSIFNGLSKLKEDCEITDTVLIHDGNRCLVSGDIIADSLATYNRYGSAIAAIPCVEVVFDSKNGISSHKSYNRNNLWRTQTPHTYSLGKLLWAHEQANKKGIKNTAATCELMEILGEDIYFSKGSELNLKITTMDDLEIFKALIANN